MNNKYTPWLIITLSLFLLSMSLTADGAGRLNWLLPIKLTKQLWQGAKVIYNIDVSKASIANHQPTPEPTPEQEGQRGEGRTIDDVYKGMKDE